MTSNVWTITLSEGTLDLISNKLPLEKQDKWTTTVHLIIKIKFMTTSVIKLWYAEGTLTTCSCTRNAGVTQPSEDIWRSRSQIKCKSSEPPVCNDSCTPILLRHKVPTVGASKYYTRYHRYCSCKILQIYPQDKQTNISVLAQGNTLNNLALILLCWSQRAGLHFSCAE